MYVLNYTVPVDSNVMLQNMYKNTEDNCTKEHKSTS